MNVDVKTHIFITSLQHDLLGSCHSQYQSELLPQELSPHLRCRNDTTQTDFPKPFPTMEDLGVMNAREKTNRFPLFFPKAIRENGVITSLRHPYEKVLNGTLVHRYKFRSSHSRARTDLFQENCSASPSSTSQVSGSAQGMSSIPDEKSIRTNLVLKRPQGRLPGFESNFFSINPSDLKKNKGQLAKWHVGEELA